ncbi:MAG: hypothetical protein HY922_14275 [Elusimicrobia bacterium]|nr:hypothetical protein [Elusimicrobiota bacterium]
MDNLLLGKPLPRPLTEKRKMKEIFGDSLNMDKLSIQRNSFTAFGLLPPHVVGNTIYMPAESDGDQLLTPDGRLTKEGMDTLIHESGHAWQYQHAGDNYIHEALWADTKALFRDGKTEKAYDWQKDVGKVEFENLNPEQQAQLIRDYYVPEEKAKLTPEQLKYAQRAMAKVKAGEGAH